MTQLKEGHAIVAPAVLWGHLRPLLHTTINLLSVNPLLHLTLLLPPAAADRARTELERDSPSLLAQDAKARQAGQVPTVERLRTVVVKSEGYEVPKVFSWGSWREGEEDYRRNFGGAVERLLGEAGLGAPSFVIFDSSHHWIPSAMRSIIATVHGGDSKVPPLIAFCPTNAATAWDLVASEESGGRYREMYRLTQEDIKQGLDPVEAAEKHGKTTYGTLRKLAALGPLYDYEWWPLQDTMDSDPEMLEIFLNIHLAVIDKDTVALLLPCTADLEEESHAMLERELGKKVYMIGPQFPDSMWTGEARSKAVSKEDMKVLTFLNTMQKRHGRRSVCYISLGSLFYPNHRPELIGYLLHTLHAAGVPFIFAHASDHAHLPHSLIQRLETDENTCLAKFAPQWTVLNHEATGFFVTHCGSNSTMETILAQVPVVTMPFAFDQGAFAYYLTTVAGCGIDLKQVKTFSNPAFCELADGTIVEGTEQAIMDEMTATWERMANERDKMAGNVGVLRDIVTKSWKEGRSRADLEALGRCF
ncbi:hypothetical protein IAT38_001880 [Cryptococcus sp. DSM 104549]